jgi:hypothetical protein
MEKESVEELMQRVNRQVVAIIEHQMAIVALLDRIEAHVGKLANAPLLSAGSRDEPEVEGRRGSPSASVDLTLGASPGASGLDK